MKEYYLFVNCKAVKVTKEVYEAYYRHKNHERYLEKVNCCKTFSYTDCIRLLDYTMFNQNLLKPNTEDEVIFNTLALELHKALKQLSSRDQLIIQLLFFEDYTEQSVASILSVSQSAINQQKRKILKKLKDLLIKWL